MRVTNSAGYQNLLRDLARVQERLQKAQNQVSSGKKVTTLSDDPLAATDIIRLTGEKSEAEQYERNLQFGRSKLELADSVLDNVEHMVERLRTLGQLSFSSTSAGSSYATEASGLRDQIIAAANTAHAGRFVFGGNATTRTPYVKAADSTVTYQGNSADMPLQVSRISTLQTQIPGSQIFSGSVDVFATISNLVTAMQTGNKSGIDAELQKLGQFSDVVSTARSKIGGYINLATNIESELTSARLIREKNLSAEQAADLAQAISELQMSQNSLQATMAVGARISQLSLLDFLK